MPFRPPFIGYKSGDLFYGLSDERARLVLSLKRGGVKIDDIMTIDKFDIFSTPEIMAEARSKNPKNILLKHDQKFSDFLRGKDKTTLILDQDLNDDRLWEGPDRTRLQNIARRKCKAGLDYIIFNTPNHIHFCLDGLNILSVAQKTYAGTGTRDTDAPAGTPEDEEWRSKSRSITGAELRWVFKNRFSLKVSEKVQFWKENKQVVPPWISNPIPWRLNQRNPENSPHQDVLYRRFMEAVNKAIMRYNSKFKIFTQSKESKSTHGYLKSVRGLEPQELCFIVQDVLRGDYMGVERPNGRNTDLLTLRAGGYTPKELNQDSSFYEYLQDEITAAGFLTTR